MKVVAFVPIKLNSMRLKNKNILPIAGHPLCWYICNSLLNVEKIDEVYVYCSDEKITEYIPNKAIFRKRESVLDRDEIKGMQIYESFINEVEADVYILAHATSPFVRASSIENSLEQVLSGKYDSAFTAERFQTFAWYKGNALNYELDDIPRTQDIEPIWIETSAFYIFNKDVFNKYHRRIGLNPYIQEVTGLEAIDIDEKKDYEKACNMVKTEDFI